MDSTWKTNDPLRPPEPHTTTALTGHVFVWPRKAEYAAREGHVRPSPAAGSCVARGGRVRVIAELGSNHNGDWQRMIDLLDAAIEGGANAIKLQVLRHDELFLPAFKQLLEQKGAQLPLEVPTSWLVALAAICHSHDCELLASLFSPTMVGRCAYLLDGIKIASGDLTYQELLRTVAQENKPIYLSTGAAWAEEVNTAVDLLLQEGERDVTVMHCISRYPCPAHEAQLGMMLDLQDPIVKIGYSDHTADWRVMAIAHTLGATAIEFHFDLGDGRGQEAGHSLTPIGLKQLTSWLDLYAQLKQPASKQPLPAEEQERLLARRMNWDGLWLRPASRQFAEVL